jgi:hypothetical protein
MEDVPEGRHVLVGTFSLNGHPIVIIFDSNATHDFIRKAYTQKHNLAIKSIDAPYMIRTPRGNIFTKKLAVSTPLNLAGIFYFKNFKLHNHILFQKFQAQEVSFLIKSSLIHLKSKFKV